MARLPRALSALIVVSFCALLFIIYHNLEILDTTAKNNAHQLQERLHAMQNKLDEMDSLVHVMRRDNEVCPTPLIQPLFS
jgi:hypothetical protein